METVTPQHFLVLAFLLFAVGFLGVVIRRNLLLVLMSLDSHLYHDWIMGRTGPQKRGP